jgi:hypothetical protein
VAKLKYTDSEPIRSYTAISMWQTKGASVGYDEITRQISIFQGAVHLAYPIEEWAKLIQAVEKALPAPLATLLAETQVTA